MCAISACIELPALRERAGDVRLLAQAFLKRYGKARVRVLDDEAMTVLERYHWPGNVRELQNVIERACALADRHARSSTPDRGRRNSCVSIARRLAGGLAAGDGPSAHGR